MASISTRKGGTDDTGPRKPKQCSFEEEVQWPQSPRGKEGQMI